MHGDVSLNDGFVPMNELKSNPCHFDRVITSGEIFHTMYSLRCSRL